MYITHAGNDLKGEWLCISIPIVLLANHCRITIFVEQDNKQHFYLFQYNTHKLYQVFSIIHIGLTVCEITFEIWLIHCHDIIKFARTQVELSGHCVKIY